MSQNKYNLVWREKNREKHLAYMRALYQKNKSENQRKALENHHRNKVERNEQSRAWHRNNKQRTAARLVKWREANPQRNREIDNSYRARRSIRDVCFRIRRNTRTRITNCVMRGAKKSSSIKYLGCSALELKAHLEAQFTGGMSWENYGDVWEMDHIVPCYTFDLSKQEEIHRCFNYRNVRPLTKEENCRRYHLEKTS